MSNCPPQDADALPTMPNCSPPSPYLAKLPPHTRASQCCCERFHTASLFLCQDMACVACCDPRVAPQAMFTSAKNIFFGVWLISQSAFSTVLKHLAVLQMRFLILGFRVAQFRVPWMRIFLWRPYTDIFCKSYQYPFAMAP